MDSHFTDDISDRRAGFRLAKGLSDLFRGMTFSHWQRLLKVRRYFADISRVPLV